MPFCEACDRHWTPTSMRPDGSCPTCGRVLPRVEAGGTAARGVPPRMAEVDGVDGPEGVDEVGEADELPSAPWHFKVMLAALVIYLAWRGVQGLGWLAGRL